MDIIQFQVENLIKGDHKGGKKTVGRFRAREIDSKKMCDSCGGVKFAELEMLTTSSTFRHRDSEVRDSFLATLTQFLEVLKVVSGAQKACLSLPIDPTACTKTTTRDKFGPCYSPSLPRENAF